MTEAFDEELAGQPFPPPLSRTMFSFRPPWMGCAGLIPLSWLHAEP